MEGSWNSKPKSRTTKDHGQIHENGMDDLEAHSAQKHLVDISVHGSWGLEIVSIFTSVLALAAIIGLLSHFDGHALPNWPKEITLNTLVALLTAIANASMVAPLSSGLSQLKWLHFHGKRRQLTDIELFDDASRGVYGSFRLLLLGRGEYVYPFQVLQQSQ